MKPELIEKIVRIYNEGQDKYKAEKGGLYFANLVHEWINIYDAKKEVLSHLSGLALYGFLISREFGFFEALAWVKLKSDVEDISEQGIKELAFELAITFLFAEDKDKWLEENL